MDSNIQFK